MKKSILIFAGVVIGCFAIFALAQAQAQSPAELAFVNHIQANIPEQDVFIQATSTNQVMRIEGEAAATANRTKSLFATATTTPHDHFKLGQSPLGPFTKGKSLGFTLGKWLDGMATGTYMVSGNSATLNVSMRNLVPNATYTVWCSRISFPPNPSVVDRPCGAADGSQNVVRTNAQGNASYSVTMAPLEPTTPQTVSAIALAYHSDGKTYGADPGEFGRNTHVQIFAAVPAPQAATGTTATTSIATSTPIEGLGSWLWIIIIIVVVLAVAFLVR